MLTDIMMGHMIDNCLILVIGLDWPTVFSFCSHTSLVYDSVNSVNILFTM